jgi:hypothetical protein
VNPSCSFSIHVWLSTLLAATLMQVPAVEATAQALTQRML